MVFFFDVLNECIIIFLLFTEILNINSVLYLDGFNPFNDITSTIIS